MAKENLCNLLEKRSPWNINSIPVEEKNELRAFFENHGFSTSTFYLRFFRKGFDEWEIEGIDDCKSQFLNQADVAQCLLDYEEPEELGGSHGDKGYLYTLAQSDSTNVFYCCLKRADSGLCLKFARFMADRDMCASVMRRRFTEEDWKPWERIGIRNLLQQYLETKYA